jgi:peptidoglycan hydrolase-like amidase
MLAGRVAPAIVAIFASLIALPASLALPATAFAGAAPKHCTVWDSQTEPPKTIRVYRVSEGKVDTVDFKDYVMRVVSREWNVKQGALRKAGAVAVKQYAWYYVLHYRGGKYNGSCYDVKDTTADQLYAEKAVVGLPSSVKSAVNDTWLWTVRRDGKFPLTGYRRGAKVGCADNAAYRLYVRSARQCAKAGWSAERILATYYSGTVLGVE